MSFVAKSRTHTTYTETGDARGADIPSIREICLQSILTGTPTKAEAQALVAQHHPGAAGATKFAKHYNWYKSWLKNEAKPKQVQALVTRFSVSEEQLNQVLGQ